MSATIPSTTAVHLRLLGTPRLISAGRELRFPDRRGIALLAMLASDGTLRRERVASLLWDVQADTDARRNLRRELHRLRDAGFDDVIASRGDGLALRPRVELDTAQFQSACAAGDAAGALALYGTGLLPGFELSGAPGFNDWLAARRETLAQAWRAQVDAHALALQAHGDLRGALAVAQAVIAQDQLQESHYRRVMVLHSLLGEREAALDAYERCRRALGRELGLRPLADTTELAERIRSGRGSGAPTERPTAASATLMVALPELAVPVGREALLDQLEQCLVDRPLTVIEGVAGVGKSTLFRALHARRPERVWHEARASDARVPFAALVRWLRAGLGGGRPAASWPGWVGVELARLLPELGDAPPPITSDAQRLRFYEALREAWMSCFGAATSHLFDDWQFVDDASAQWWAWWQGRSPGTRLIVALRPDQARPEAAEALASAARESGAPTLTVPVLDEAGMFALVQRLSGVARPERFAQRLLQATGGHPFFAIETLRHLFEQGVIHIDDQGQWTTPFDEATADYRELPIPPSVHAAITHRLHALGEPTRRLLEAASLTGDDFRLELVSSASALGEWESVAALESALRAHVVRRHPDQSGVYRFEHDLFAQVVADSLLPERAALLHRSLGNGLARMEADPVRVAGHFERGGDTTAACRHRLRALEAARRRHAVSDMLEQSERLLALRPEATVAFAAHLAAAEAWRSRADAPRARAALALAEDLLREGDPAELHVRLILAQALNAQGEGRSETMLEPITRRLADGGLSDDERGRLLTARGDALRVLGRNDASLADLRAALAAFGDEPSVARGELLDSLARTSLHASDLPSALADAQTALAVMRALDHAGGVARALTLIGVTHLTAGRLAQAAAPLEEARSIAHAHGLISIERGAILNLVPLQLGQGRVREAIATLEEGFTLSSLFGLKAEEQAFLEARFHCRVVAGELGEALDARRALTAFSEAVGERFRMISGLLVATDLPLALGDLDAASESMAPVLAVLDDLGSDSLSVRARCIAASMALDRADLAGAQTHLDALTSNVPQRNEERVWLQGVRSRFALASGRHEDARAALDAPREEVPPDTWAGYLAIAVTVEHACGGVSAGTLAAAQRELGGDTLPPLEALTVIDALVAAGVGEPWRSEGARLFTGLHESLARHPRERELFEKRFRRLG